MLYLGPSSNENVFIFLLIIIVPYREMEMPEVFKMAFYVFYPYLQNSVSCVQIELQIRLNILTFIFI